MTVTEGGETYTSDESQSGRFYFSDSYLHWKDDNSDITEEYEYERMTE